MQSRIFPMTISIWLVSASLVFSFFFSHPFRTPKVLCLSGLLILIFVGVGKMAKIKALPLFLTVWPLVTVFWITNYWHYAEGIFLLIFLVFCAIVSGSIDQDTRQALRRGLAWAGPPVALYLLVQRLALDPLSFEQGRLAGSFFGNPNASAHFLLVCLCLGRFESRWFRATGWSAIFLGLLASQSRGSWLGLLIFLFLNRRWLSPGLQKVGFMLALAGLAATILFFGSDLRRFAFFASHPDSYVSAYQAQPHLIEDREPWFRGKRLSLMTRVFLMSNSFSMLAERPLTGIGLGQFHVVYPKYARARVNDINMNQDYRAVSSHNLLLDAAIQLGFPWLTLAFFWMFSLFRLVDRDYKIALAVQFVIAMFSINYLNPMIVSALIVLRPLENNSSGPDSRKVAAILSLVFAGLLAVFSYLDHRALPGKAVPPDLISARIFPQHQVDHFYALGDYNAAWRYQLRALDQDPYGPETIYNTGIIAWELGEDGDPRWHDLAITAFRVNRRLHPFFKPAEIRLSQIEERGFLPDRLRDAEPSQPDLMALIREMRRPP